MDISEFYANLTPANVALCEQYQAQANTALQTMTESMLNDIKLREDTTGIHDDSVHFSMLQKLLMAETLKNPAFGLPFMTAMLAAAITQLARAPRADDPLEAQFNNPSKDEGTQQ